MRAAGDRESKVIRTRFRPNPRYILTRHFVESEGAMAKELDDVVGRIAEIEIGKSTMIAAEQIDDEITVAIARTVSR